MLCSQEAPKVARIQQNVVLAQTEVVQNSSVWAPAWQSTKEPGTEAACCKGKINQVLGQVEIPAAAPAATSIGVEELLKLRKGMKRISI